MKRPPPRRQGRQEVPSHLARVRRSRCACPPLARAWWPRLRGHAVLGVLGALAVISSVLARRIFRGALQEKLNHKDPMPACRRVGWDEKTTAKTPRAPRGTVTSRPGPPQPVCLPPVGSCLVAPPEGPCSSWRSWRLGGDQFCSGATYFQGRTQRAQRTTATDLFEVISVFLVMPLLAQCGRQISTTSMSPISSSRKRLPTSFRRLLASVSWTRRLPRALSVR